MRYQIYRWLQKHLGGHISLGRRVTIYGFNAMQVAINIYTNRWGYVCFHPPVPFMHWYEGWYFYVSPNATPSVSTFAIGAGVDRETKRKSKLRRQVFGHNFNDRIIYDNEALHREYLG